MNRNTTIVLVAVFALLGLYVLLVQQPKDKAAQATATPGPTSAAVWAITAEKITGIRIVDRVKNRSVAFAKDAQGVWAVTEPEARSADQSLASSSAARFVTLYVSLTITQSADLTPFGVLSPTYALEVKLADGTQLKAVVGDKTPTGSGYYLLREGENTPVVVASGTLEALVALLDNPPYFVPAATPGPTVNLVVTPPALTATASAAPGRTAQPSPAASETPAPANPASATP